MTTELIIGFDCYLYKELTVNKSVKILLNGLPNICSVVPLTSCGKDPTLSGLLTMNIFHITQKSAVPGWNITNDGGASIISRGVCWTTTNNPTNANQVTTDGSVTGSFTSNLTLKL